MFVHFFEKKKQALRALLCAFFMMVAFAQQDLVGAILLDDDVIASGATSTRGAVTDRSSTSIAVYSSKFATPKTVEVLPEDDIYDLLFKLGIKKVEELVGSIAWRCDPATGHIKGKKSDENHLIRDVKFSEHGVKGGDGILLEWVTPLKSGIQVFVEKPDGEEIEVAIDPSELTIYTKARIEVAACVIRERQNLCFIGSEMEDFTQIFCYDVEEGHTLVITSKEGLRGATKGFSSFSFSFTDLINGKEMKWSKSAPLWRRGAPGFNIHGVCRTPGCVAEGKKVTINLGYGDFNMIAIVRTSFCPMCKDQKKRKWVKEVHSCYFVKCAYEYSGLIAIDDEENGIKQIEGSGQYDGDGYLYFKGEDGDEASSLANWCFLQIKVTKLGK